MGKIFHILALILILAEGLRRCNVVKKNELTNFSWKTKEGGGYAIAMSDVGA